MINKFWMQFIFFSENILEIAQEIGSIFSIYLLLIELSTAHGNSGRPGKACMWKGAELLFQTMASCLFGAQPSYERMIYWC